MLRVTGSLGSRRLRGPRRRRALPRRRWRWPGSWLRAPPGDGLRRRRAANPLLSVRITSPLGRTRAARHHPHRRAGLASAEGGSRIGQVLRERRAGWRRRRRSAVRRRVDRRESLRADAHSRRGERCTGQHRLGCDRSRSVRDCRDSGRLAGAARSDRRWTRPTGSSAAWTPLRSACWRTTSPDDRPRQRRIAAGDLYPARGREPEHARPHGVRSRGRRAARRLPPAEGSHHRGAVREVARSDHRADRRSRDDRGRRPGDLGQRRHGDCRRAHRGLAPRRRAPTAGM